MTHQLVNLAVAFVSVAASVWVGFRIGYQRGFADSEWSHDFDRCPHCGEAPDDEKES